MAENYFGLTDTGRQRNNNEDAFLTEQVLQDKFIAAGVIDGVGGYEGGEVAARLARQAILDYFSVPSGSVLTMMQEALVAANEKIYNEKKQHAQLDKMACVATLALIEKGASKFYYAHVGDTRLYLYRDGSLVKVTKDHSFVGFLEDSGRLDEAAAMSHPKRNEINKALGFEAPLQNPGDYIETGESPFLPGDLLLLCSDGLTDMINRKEISTILSSGNNLQQKAASLVEAANKAGGKDNITVVLVQNDYAPARQTATKPVKKNESPITADKQVHPVNTVKQKEVVYHPKAKMLILFLALLTILSLAGFLWQWMGKRKLEHEVHPVGSVNTTSSSEKSNFFQDTLQRLTGKELILDPRLFNDVVALNDTVIIMKDSLHLKGIGSTILAPDSTNRQNVVFIVSPSVQYLLLDSLTLQDVDLFVPAGSEMVHFKQVRMQNATIYVTHTVADSLVTAVIKGGQLVKDSIVKKGKTIDGNTATKEQVAGTDLSSGH